MNRFRSSPYQNAQTERPYREGYSDGYQQAQRDMQRLQRDHRDWSLSRIANTMTAFNVGFLSQWALNNLDRPQDPPTLDDFGG